MSQENLESFHRGMDAWNRGDLEAWLEWLHPEVEWHPSAALVEGGRVSRPRGLAEVLERHRGRCR